MAENKKKFTTFVKSLIFEEDKTPTKPVETSENEATTQTSSNVIPNQPSTFGTTTGVSSVINNPTSGNGGIQGVVDTEQLKILCEVLDKANIPGPDYLELKNAADAMQQFLPEESQRFIASYTSLKCNNPHMNKSIIMSSIDEYINVMEGERSKGLTELQNIRQTEVIAKEEQLKSVSEELEQLKARMAEITNFMSTTNNEIFKAKMECDMKEANFNATVDVIVNSLKSDKEKLDKIIVE